MEFRVTDLLIEATTKKKKRPYKPKATKKHCGKKGSCFRCTRCTSTAISQHKPEPMGTYKTCTVKSYSEIRAELMAQLQEILAVPTRPERPARREAA